MERLTRLEQMPPMPAMETPKPQTLDDIILGMIGRESNTDGK